MQDDAADRDDDLDAEREQPVAQPGHLGAGARGARGSQPQFLHQDKGGGGQEHAQLIGPEATAARAPDLETVMEFLDPVFNVAPGTVIRS